MKEIGKDASLHEATVQQVARDEIKKPRKTRSDKGKPRKKRKPELTHTRVDPRVWKTAQQIVRAGVYLRIEILGENEVIVR